MTLDTHTIRTAIDRIEAAFASVPAPDDTQLLHPQCRDDGDIVDFYGLRDRNQLTDDLIIRNYAAPSFFSEEAFQYYMPAFMIWSLKNHDTVEYAPESTLRAFDPSGPDPAFQISKFALFTGPQRAAVIDFLWAFSGEPDLGPIADDALAHYWLDQQPAMD